MEPSVAYVIHRAELRKLIMTRPEVTETVVQTLASALRQLVTLVEDLSLRHVTARVAKMLLDQEATNREGRAHCAACGPNTAGVASQERERRRLKAVPHAHRSRSDPSGLPPVGAGPVKDNSTIFVFLATGAPRQDVFGPFQVHSQRSEDDGRVGLSSMPNGKMNAIQVQDAIVGEQM